GDAAAPPSTPGALHAKIGRRGNAVDLVRDALPLPAKTAYFPIVTVGMLSCRTAACKQSGGGGFRMAIKGPLDGETGCRMDWRCGTKRQNIGDLPKRLKTYYKTRASRLGSGL